MQRHLRQVSRAGCRGRRRASARCRANNCAESPAACQQHKVAQQYLLEITIYSPPSFGRIRHEGRRRRVHIHLQPAFFTDVLKDELGMNRGKVAVHGESAMIQQAQHLTEINNSECEERSETGHSSMFPQTHGSQRPPLLRRLPAALTHTARANQSEPPVAC